MLELIVCMDDELNSDDGPTIMAPAIRHRPMRVHVAGRQRWPKPASPLSMWVHDTIQLLLHLLGCQGNESGPAYYMRGWLNRAGSDAGSAFLKS